MVRVILVLICLHVTIFAASLDAIKLKHEWIIKKIVKMESIIKEKEKEFGMGLITMNDLTSWNQKLFNERKEKLNMEFEYRAKDSSLEPKNVNFEDSLNYVSALLNISIKNVNFYEKMIPFVRDAIKVGTMMGTDLAEFKLFAMGAYAEFEYALKLYKDHTKTRIPYKLPSDIVKALEAFK